MANEYAGAKPEKYSTTSSAQAVPAIASPWRWRRISTVSANAASTASAKVTSSPKRANTRQKVVISPIRYDGIGTSTPKTFVSRFRENTNAAGASTVMQTRKKRVSGAESESRCRLSTRTMPARPSTISVQPRNSVFSDQWSSARTSTARVIGSKSGCRTDGRTYDSGAAPRFWSWATGLLTIAATASRS